MEIKDYINKNLPNLNWNILPQIFEENDVELTEEIEAYLRNTPENTNWNVFDGMGGNGDETELPHKIYFINYENSFDTTRTSLKTEDEIVAWVNEHEGQDIEFYSYSGGLEPMGFTEYNSKQQAYLWDAHDGSGEFVWIYTDHMMHSYDD